MPALHSQSQRSLRRHQTTTAASATASRRTAALPRTTGAGLRDYNSQQFPVAAVIG